MKNLLQRGIYDLSNLPSNHIQSSYLASELLAREFDTSIRDFNNKIQGIEKQPSFPQSSLLQIVIPDDQDFMLRRSRTKKILHLLIAYNICL